MGARRTRRSKLAPTGEKQPTSMRGVCATCGNGGDEVELEMQVEWRPGLATEEQEESGQGEGDMEDESLTWKGRRKRSIYDVLTGKTEISFQSPDKEPGTGSGESALNSLQRLERVRRKLSLERTGLKSYFQ